MNQTERRIIRNVVARLRGKRACEEVKAALTGPARLYLETWVIPSLEILAREDRTRDDLSLADSLAS